MTRPWWQDEPSIRELADWLDSRGELNTRVRAALAADPAAFDDAWNDYLAEQMVGEAA